MKRFSEDSRPNIKYPTRWTYTVIGESRSDMEDAIAQAVLDRSHRLSVSNVSSGGRYISLTLELIVLNEKERLEIFEAIRRHNAVQIVL